MQNVDKRLIFSEDDFKNPRGSTVFQELDKMSSEVKRLALTLKTFCEERSIDNLKPLEDVLHSRSPLSSFPPKVLPKGPKVPPKGSLTAKDYYDQGMTYFRSGDFSHAVYQLKLAIKLKPDYAAAHYKRGLAYLKMQQLEPAKEAVEKALEISPRYIQAQKRLQEIEKQIRWIKIILKDHYNTAKSLYNQKNFAEAKNEVEKALKIDPNYKPARDLLKDIDRRNGSPYRQPKSASIRKTTVPPPQTFTPHVKRSNSKEGFYKKAIDFYNQGSFGKAKGMAEKALNLDKNYQNARNLLETIQLAYKNLAETYIKKGQDDKALAAYKEVIKIGRRLG